MFSYKVIFCNSVVNFYINGSQAHPRQSGLDFKSFESLGVPDLFLGADFEGKLTFLLCNDF